MADRFTKMTELTVAKHEMTKQYSKKMAEHYSRMTDKIIKWLSSKAKMVEFTVAMRKWLAANPSITRPSGERHAANPSITHLRWWRREGGGMDSAVAPECDNADAGAASTSGLPNQLSICAAHGSITLPTDCNCKC
jgi:hypothetical protein